MSGPALILYGSKARGDVHAGSDVDLILAIEGDELHRPTHAHGVSVHRYPKGWLEARARAGALFAWHIVFEGVALEDPDGFLPRLREIFQSKSSYQDELDLGALVLKLLLEKDWGANFEARRRFFWALRTVLIAAAANAGAPVFSSASLEASSGVPGTAALINRRDDADFAACRTVGLAILHKYLPKDFAALEGETLRQMLMERGGIGRDSVRVLEVSEAISDIGLAIYL